MKNLDKKWIKVKGAREHNLKDISVNIPKESLTVITGPSGSGKSSLALDVLYTEGKRRYVESLSSYARQFLGLPKKPDVDSIEGLCPAIAIDQKTVGSNPRSTVGTITEVYDYIRVLFARIGTLMCPQCAVSIQAESPDKIAHALIENFKNNYILVAAPLAMHKKGEFTHELEKLFESGYYRFLIDGQQHAFRKKEDIAALNLKKTEHHSIDVLLDAVEVELEEAARLQDAIEKSFDIAKGLCKVIVGSQEYTYAQERICLSCSFSFPEVEPRLFSFNSPIGACRRCHGLGMVYDISCYEAEDFNIEQITCGSCKGQRLNKAALAVTINNKNIYNLGEMSLAALKEFFDNLPLTQAQQLITDRLVAEIVTRLTFLIDVGLGYLSLNRTARTLSGGEGQRIRLATQIGSALSGVLYILDEPSIGLHQKDNNKLIKTLLKLRDLGNTVLVVEHDIDTMNNADYIIDMGPAAGRWGGHVVAVGTPQEIADNRSSLTGDYLSKRRSIKVPTKLRTPQGYIELKNAHKHNLKDLTVNFPLKVLCGISGVSGSGKSTLIMEELVFALKPLLEYKKRRYSDSEDINSKSLNIAGYKDIENMVVIDQAPIGRTSRSTPATYLGIFDHIRDLFARLPESNARGYKVGRFSFNVAQGRCSDCSGEGIITISMHFLADVAVICNTCKGKRFNAQTLEINYKNKNIADILEMTAGEAVEFFDSHNILKKKLQLMCDVGLDYIALGQSSTTLSGGEAQRIKLSSELSKRGSNTLYILDEPTTGLHSSDIEKLLKVLNALVNKGNSLIVIEHNLDVLKTTDYIIDLGPEGGDAGGTIVAYGTPQQISQESKSYTGVYLRPLLTLY